MTGNHKFICILLLAVVSAQEFPSYIKKCKNDKDLNHCVLTNGRQALEHILNGDEKLGIPSFKPYKHPGAIRFGSTPNIQLVTDNFELYGMDKITIKNATWDVENRKVNLVSHYDNTTCVFDYKMTGNFLDHTMNASGRGSITCENALFRDEITYGVHTVNGVNYPKVENIDVEYEVETCTFKLKDLADTDNTSEVELNNLLSANWDKFNEMTKYDSKEFNTQVTKLILDSIFKTVPINELFE